MKLPKLTALQTSRELIDAFGGYNHNLRIGKGEFYDMKNLTSSSYPVLSSRPFRGVYAKPVSAQGMIAKDSLCYVDGRNFIINGYPVDMGLSTDPKDCPKSLISMGSYVIIMPDKMYINTIANEEDNSFEFGNIEASVMTTGTVSFELCKIDGVGYENTKDSPTAPIITEEMEKDTSLIPMWIDTSSTPHTLKQYSSSSGTWVAVATTYIKISCSDAGIFDEFEVNDGVTISGIKVAALSDLNNTVIIWAKGSDYIVVTGILNELATQDTPITITRRMPNMDFIIESENRLWGCRYGVALNGEVVNEIYASKLGDFKNWNVFHTPSISTDSYVASVGTDGQFTGAITHLGYPLFFKENCVHKVYGNYPANFQIQTTTCRGVQKGCSKSLAIVNEVLYYKSRSSVCAYDGSLPVEISSALGDVVYHSAVAGSLGNKYYISMADSSNKYHLFVYDTARGMWHREDDLRAREFCTCRGDLYFIEDTLGIIKAVHGSDCTKESMETSVDWMAETGIIGVDSPDKKYISRIDIRASMDIGARIYIYAQYDSSDIWEQVYTMVAPALRTFAIPIKPKRCDHMRLRIEGIGEAKLYSICKTITQGSDI